MWGRAAVVGVALVGAAVACADDSGPAPETPPPASSAPPVAADWPTAGQDLRNSRAAVGSTISAANVERLEETWRAELPESIALTTTPLVVGDEVLLQGGNGQIVSLDRSTGDRRWAGEATGFNIGPFGVAAGDGLVFGMDGDDGVVAVDGSSGEEVWATDITATDTTGTDIQPVVVGDLVIAASVPISLGGIYTGGDRGVVTALEAATGEVHWRFDTVEGDLWGHPEVNSGGGAWYPPVVDEERGLVYVGVANPAPFPGTDEFPNGTSRPGPNLYTDSVVALDLGTGELAWYHQVTPHDLFDRDQVHVTMARIEDGRDVLVSSGKSGVVVGLDPDDGSVLWRTEVGHHRNDDLDALDGPTTVAPGTYGGVLTPPSTADGVVYLATVDAPTELRPDETAYFGAPLGSHDGEVTAVDAGTGEVRWRTDVPGDPLGGTTVVNDLVLTATLQGTIVALDRASGEIRWRHDAVGGINGWMAVAGDTLYVPVSNASPPALVALALP